MGQTTSPSVTRVLGVDRWRKGWVVAETNLKPHSESFPLSVSHAPTIDDVLALSDTAAAVAIDMPMALPETGRRDAEVHLKAHLGRAGRSVFYSPTVGALACDGRAAADAVNRQADGGGISAQAWGLAGSIRELRQSLAGHDQQPSWWETHPETSFVAMRAEGPLSQDNPLSPKKSGRGVAERLALLALNFGDVLPTIANADCAAPIDDVLDAIAAAWSARRIVTGQATVFGPSGHDHAGFPLGIRI